MTTMFRKPPSKWEVLSDKLGDVAEVVGDKAGVAAQKLEHVASAVGHAASTVGHAASSAGHAVAAKAGSLRHEPTPLEKLGHAVSDLPLENLKGSALGVAGAVRESVSDATSRGLHVARSSAEAARHAAEAARHKAESAFHLAADHAGEHAEKAQRAIQSKKSEAAGGLALAHKLSEKMARKAAKRAVKEHNEVSSNALKLISRSDDSSSKLLWLLGGVLIGAVVALLLTPTTGRRSRALIKDKLGKAGRGVASAGSTAKTRAADLSRRAAGKIHEARSANAPDDADDITIAQRVRTALGEHPATRNMERLNVDCVHGIVTVRGPIADEELQAQIEKIARGVKGVSDVQSFLLTEESPEDQATFVG
jgi:hypothetical protein